MQEDAKEKARKLFSVLTVIHHDGCCDDGVHGVCHGSCSVSSLLLSSLFLEHTKVVTSPLSLLLAEDKSE